MWNIFIQAGESDLLGADSNTVAFSATMTADLINVYVHRAQNSSAHLQRLETLIPPTSIGDFLLTMGEIRKAKLILSSKPPCLKYLCFCHVRDYEDIVVEEHRRPKMSQISSEFTRLGGIMRLTVHTLSRA